MVHSEGGLSFKVMKFVEQWIIECWVGPDCRGNELKIESWLEYPFSWDQYCYRESHERCPYSRYLYSTSNGLAPYSINTQFSLLSWSHTSITEKNIPQSYSHITDHRITPATLPPYPHTPCFQKTANQPTSQKPTKSLTQSASQLTNQLVDK